MRRQNTKLRITGLYIADFNTDWCRRLPGFGLPVEHMPPWSHNPAKSKRFPHAIADFFANEGVTVRECRMLDFISRISDKPEWERKVFDEEIVEKWRAEGCVRNEAIRDDILSKRMFDFVSSNCFIFLASLDGK